MKKKEYSVIGLMSGTSLDGLDIAHVTLSVDGRIWSYDIGKHESLNYDSQMRDRLKQSVSLSGLELLLFNNDYGRWLGERTKNFIGKNKIEIDLIASHGHTVFHQIDKRLTYQLGSGQELANVAGHQVVSDFRTLDVSLGGQGAPLVPIGDQLLFGAYEACLNLGGIANASFDKAGVRVAYDIAPANMLLNFLMEKLGKTYDHNGNVARTGQLDVALFDQLNSLAYYHMPFPKSTGFEWFSDEVVPIVEASSASISDKLFTAVHHTAFQIGQHLLPEIPSGGRMLVTGGGARNGFLIDTIEQYLETNIKVCIPDEKIIDFKEAMVFALMGVLFVREEINCLSSVTGAAFDSCAGHSFFPVKNK